MHLQFLRPVFVLSSLELVVSCVSRVRTTTSGRGACSVAETSERSHTFLASTERRDRHTFAGQPQAPELRFRIGPCWLPGDGENQEKMSQACKSLHYARVMVNPGGAGEEYRIVEAPVTRFNASAVWHLAA